MRFCEECLCQKIFGIKTRDFVKYKYFKNMFCGKEDLEKKRHLKKRYCEKKDLVKKNCEKIFEKMTLCKKNPFFF